MSAVTKIQAVIFDKDGLLLDTEQLAVKANKIACDKIGFRRDLEDFKCLAGKNRELIAELLSEWMGIKVDCDAYHRRWRAACDTLTRVSVDLRPTVLRVLKHVDQTGLPKAIATTTERDHALVKLSKAGLAGCFETIVGFNCVENRKPAPDPYLAAASALSVDPAKCVAFEDSDVGVRSALAAKMTVVQVPDIAPAIERRAHYRADTLWDGLVMAGLSG